jgi:CheY-like chemotaxis protein
MRCVRLVAHRRAFSCIFHRIPVRNEAYLDRGGKVPRECLGKKLYCEGMHSTRLETTNAADSKGGHQLRILVVDDDLFLCAYNAEILGDAGFEVDIAEDGEAGWQALLGKDYDLLITDNNMPKVCGIELLKRVHAESLDIPVIMVSGAMPVEEFARNPGLPLAATLPKPFTGQSLLGVVKKVLKTAEGTRMSAEGQRTRAGKHTVEAAPA